MQETCLLEIAFLALSGMLGGGLEGSGGGVWECEWETITRTRGDDGFGTQNTREF